MNFYDILTVGQQLSSNANLDAVLLARGEVAYLLNSECTVLLRYSGVSNCPAGEVRVRCSDVEAGAILTMLGNQVRFASAAGPYSRAKTVSAPNRFFSEADEAFKQLSAKVPSNAPTFEIVAGAGGILSQLDESMSHVEVERKGGALTIIQRDLASGAIITLAERAGKVSMFAAGLPDFPRIALRTKDLVGMMLLQPKLTFTVGEGIVLGRGAGYDVVLSQCTYDAMYELTQLTGDTDGRQKPNNVPSQSSDGGAAEAIKGTERG